MDCAAYIFIAPHKKLPENYGLRAFVLII